MTKKIDARRRIAFALDVRSIVMSTEGIIRIGILAHHGGRNQYDGNNYTGDMLPDGTLAFVSEDCASSTIP